MNRLWLDQWPSSDIDKLAVAYASAAPYPHVDIGGILPDDVARVVCTEFPDLNDSVWSANGRRYTNSFADKYEMTQLDAMGPATRSTIWCSLPDVPEPDRESSHAIV